MKLKEILASVQEIIVSENFNQSTDVKGISSDSRQIKPGYIFVAIKGALSNGEDFIDQAISNGAIAIVAQSEINVQCSFIQVKNSYLALALLAEDFQGHPAADLKLIGLTGTNGKSSSSFILEHILHFNKVKTGVLGTIHNRFAETVEDSKLTTPDALTLQSLLLRMKDAHVETVVMEVSSHALEQYRCGLANFSLALFSNLTQDHLDYHGDMESYYQSKKKLFTEGLNESGTALINIEDEYGARLFEEIKCNKLSIGSDGDYQISAIVQNRNSLTYTLSFAGEETLMQVPLLGEFNVMNSALAVAAAHQCGISFQQSYQALHEFSGIPGRMEFFESVCGKRIFVDFAHTPDALEKVLITLKELDATVHCLFGCGGDRDRSKRKLMAQAVDVHADYIYLTDDNPRSEDPQQIFADVLKGLSDAPKVYRQHDRRAAIKYAFEQMGHHDILLIAGKGHEEYQIYGKERIAYSDRQVVCELLENKNA